MNIFSTPEISDSVFHVGCIDWKRRVFDALAPTPLGTTYNGYVVKGKSKTALIDTNHPDFETEYTGKVASVCSDGKVDFIIMNHAEPDHAGLIAKMLDTYPATLLTTKKGAELAGAYFGIGEDRIKVVNNNDTLDLGGKTLRFIPQPFIHWPETMMTYLEENKLLFSCDFFAAHNTTGLFDDQAEDVITWAKKYYAEIMMPLAKPARQAMDKVAELDIAMIAPSHGPVYKDPATIIRHYQDWTQGKTKNKAVVLYVSMYRMTERMVHMFVEPLHEQGIDVRVLDLSQTDMGELAGHLVDARALVIASPTVLGNLHPLVAQAATVITMEKPPVTLGAIIGSYGWGKGAVRKGLEFFEEAGIEPVTTVEVQGRPTDDDTQRIQASARELADKILAG